MVTSAMAWISPSSFNLLPICRLGVKVEEVGRRRKRRTRWRRMMSSDDDGDEDEDPSPGLGLHGEGELYLVEHVALLRRPLPHLPHRHEHLGRAGENRRNKVQFLSTSRDMLHPISKSPSSSSRIKRRGDEERREFENTPGNKLKICQFCVCPRTSFSRSSSASLQKAFFCLAVADWVPYLARGSGGARGQGSGVRGHHHCTCRSSIYHLNFTCERKMEISVFKNNLHCSALQ